MKKIFFASLAVLTLVSCTKDWTCECTSAQGATWVQTTYKDSKKDVAENGCSTWSTAVAASNGGSCSIK